MAKSHCFLLDLTCLYVTIFRPYPVMISIKEMISVWIHCRGLPACSWLQDQGHISYMEQNIAPDRWYFMGITLNCYCSTRAGCVGKSHSPSLFHWCWLGESELWSHLLPSFWAWLSRKRTFLMLPWAQGLLLCLTYVRAALERNAPYLPHDTTYPH